MPAFEAPEYINPLRMSPEELIAWMEAKAPRSIGAWNELGPEEYARSFTAARTAGYSIVRDLQRTYLQVLAEDGATMDDFVDRMMPILRKKGWLADKSADQQADRLRLIFDTNLRMALANGRWERIQKVKLALPYLEARTAGDSRVRHPPQSDEDHRAFEGIILPVDHPFWKDYFPPLGFRCRCFVLQRSRAQIARRGLQVTGEGELTARIARLGAPWGFRPDRPPERQIADMTERANQERPEGAPPIEYQREAQRGALLWSTLTGRIFQAGAIAALIEKLFGS